VSNVRLNPYVSLLAGAVEEADSSVRCVSWTKLPLPLLAGRRVDVVHLHWPELLWMSASLRRSMRRLLVLLVGLSLVKLRGIGMVYTVHNLSPHQERFPRLGPLVNRLIVGLADAVHVHDEWARGEVARRFGRTRGVFVIPHGSYIGCYPDKCSRGEARAKLGIPSDAFLYLFLGGIRPYKGLEELLTAFARMEGEDVVLLIAGHVHREDYARRLEGLAAGDGRVRLRWGYVAPEEVQFYMRAADICVLPYREVTTSGAAMLAFSFGKPIVAPRLGPFPQLVGDGRGILYEASQEEALLEALRRARHMDLAEASRKALALAQELNWASLAPHFLALYRQTKSRRR